MKKGVFISTTEHMLSAFIGLGIDNAFVELDNLELPILDGSALPFVELIQKAGLRKQRRPRRYMKILREVEMREGNKFISVYPADSYSVSYSINFPHPLIGKETFQVELSNWSYLRKIAAARTFGSREDEKKMRNMGLIRGASRENCIVLTRDGLENGPLRFSGRVRAPQNSGFGWRSGVAGQADSGQDRRRPRWPCHAHRAGCRASSATKPCGKKLRCPKKTSTACTPAPKPPQDLRCEPAVNSKLKISLSFRPKPER